MSSAGQINFTDCSGCKVCLEPSSTFFGLDSQILTSNTHKEVNLCTSLGEEEYSDFVVPDFQRPALKGSIDVRIFYRVWVMDDGIGVSIRAHNQVDKELTSKIECSFFSFLNNSCVEFLKDSGIYSPTLQFIF